MYILGHWYWFFLFFIIIVIGVILRVVLFLFLVMSRGEWDIAFDQTRFTSSFGSGLRCPVINHRKRHRYLIDDFKKATHLQYLNIFKYAK